MADREERPWQRLRQSTGVVGAVVVAASAGMLAAESPVWAAGLGGAAAVLSALLPLVAGRRRSRAQLRRDV